MIDSIAQIEKDLQVQAIIPKGQVENHIFEGI